MTLISSLLSESPAALAEERIKTRVDVEMISQVAWRWKRSRAEAALVRFDLEVDHLVVVEVGACCEAFPAVAAFERLLACQELIISRLVKVLSKQLTSVNSFVSV